MHCCTISQVGRTSLRAQAESWGTTRKSLWLSARSHHWKPLRAGSGRHRLDSPRRPSSSTLSGEGGTYLCASCEASTYSRACADALPPRQCLVRLLEWLARWIASHPDSATMSTVHVYLYVKPQHLRALWRWHPCEIWETITMMDDTPSHFSSVSGSQPTRADASSSKSCACCP